MQKYFTKEITQPLKVIILGLVLGLGVSVASAFVTAPGTAPTCPSGYSGCDAPVNVSTTAQNKGLDPTSGQPTSSTSNLFNVWGSFIANGVSTTTWAHLAGVTQIGIAPYLATDKLSSTVQSFFNTNPVLGSGIVKIGGNDSYASGERQNALNIDLSGRSGWGMNDAININTDASRLNDPTTDSANLTTNASAFRFFSDKWQDDATVWMGRFRMTRDNPTVGAVAMASDTDGRATWGDLTGGGVDFQTVSYKCSFAQQNHSALNGLAQCQYQGYHGGANPYYDSGVDLVSCPVGYVVIGGGGSCVNGSALATSLPMKWDGSNYVAVSDGTTAPSAGGSSAVAWEATCHSGDIQAQVFCAKSVPVTVTSHVVTAAAPVAPTWHNYAGGGLPGQTCAAAYGYPASSIRLVRTSGGVVSNMATGTCLYAKTPPTSGAGDANFSVSSATASPGAAFKPQNSATLTSGSYQTQLLY